MQSREEGADGGGLSIHNTGNWISRREQWKCQIRLPLGTGWQVIGIAVDKNINEKELQGKSGMTPHLEEDKMEHSKHPGTEPLQMHPSAPVHRGLSGDGGGGTNC